MALEGTLEDFSLADIFQLIGIQRKTGVLTLRRDDETIIVKFYGGQVIGADSSPKKLEDRLGKVLVKTGLISSDQLKEALNIQQKTLQKIGFVLVDQNYLSREQLKEALQIQIVQMVFRLFRWHNGEYYFDQKAPVDPNSDDSIPPMGTESILMEGIQMIDEWPIIEKRITNFNMGFRPIVELSDLDLGVLTGESDLDAMFDKIQEPGSDGSNGANEKIRLSKEEAEVFQFLDGKSSVNDIIESSKLGEFHTCKALYELLERKLIEPIPQGETFIPLKEPTLSFMREETEEKSFNVAFLYPILILAALAVLFFSYHDPLQLPGAKFFRGENETQIKKALSQNRMNVLDNALTFFYHTNKRLPDRLDELVRSNYISKDDLLDASRRPYLYQASDTGYILAAQTDDGKVDQSLQVSRIFASAMEVKNSESN
jgi:Domain of unknown function (DUF4388)